MTADAVVLFHSPTVRLDVVPVHHVRIEGVSVLGSKKGAKIEAKGLDCILGRSGPKVGASFGAGRVDSVSAQMKCLH